MAHGTTVGGVVSSHIAVFPQSPVYRTQSLDSPNKVTLVVGTNKQTKQKTNKQTKKPMAKSNLRKGLISSSNSQVTILREVRAGAWKQEQKDHRASLLGLVSRGLLSLLSYVVRDHPHRDGERHGGQTLPHQL